MEDRFAQQLKKGALEMLVLKLICEKPAYGYELLSELKLSSQGRFSLKEGTLYPILYRLEDDGMIRSQWSTGEGRAAPKKIYEATEAGRAENLRRQRVWREFDDTVNAFLQGGRES
ncbi:MAG: PadR family transcriptional regulator [Clostridiales bacterium]|nr:PadR family transcriptional regulator [Clostridiales bacterium]